MLASQNLALPSNPLKKPLLKAEDVNSRSLVKFPYAIDSSAPSSSQLNLGL